METITNALDALGLALANHDHVWSDCERQLYESAVAISYDGYMASDLSASAKRPDQRLSRKPRLQSVPS